MNCVLCRFAIGLAGLFLTAVVMLARADNWPQWRGPSNDGVSHETSLPTEWSGDRNVVWKFKMPGWSGSTPAVWGDRIFINSEDANEIVLHCISTDGKELWKRKYGSGARNIRDEGNNASPSPSTDGKHVWIFAGTGDMACFDFDGNQVWHFNAQERYGKFRTNWGMHTTPVLYGDRLYLQLLHSNADLVIALDKNTGNEVWKVHRESDAARESRHSYASPSVWHKGKDALLITHGGDYTIALTLDDGKEVWRAGGLNPKARYRGDLRFVASPEVTPDLVVVPSAKHGPVLGVNPNATGFIDAGSPAELWHVRGTPDVPSPLVHDSLVYLCSEEGLLRCLDGRTGKELYNQRIHPAIYRASPVYGDGKIYVTAGDGTFTVVKAGPKYQRLAVNKLPDDFAASPAISGGRIYLHGFETLYAIGAGKGGRAK